MLALPTSGISQPTGTPPDLRHHIKLDIFCDWIEASVLFDEDTFSTTDIIDILTEESIYADSDSASEMVITAWNELKRRLGWIGERTPFSFVRQRIKSGSSWQEHPAHSFCLLLSMPQCYENWSTQLRQGDYTEQGRLFESLTKASCAGSLWFE